MADVARFAEVTHKAVRLVIHKHSMSARLWKIITDCINGRIPRSMRQGRPTRIERREELVSS